MGRKAPTELRIDRLPLRADPGADSLSPLKLLVVAILLLLITRPRLRP
jgi:hypothetical protein